MCGTKRGVGRLNAKYNGFSITQDGKTTNYIVVNGQVHYADLSGENIFGESSLSQIQAVYDKEQSAKGIIDRINRIGKASATTISDKDVEKMQTSRIEERAAKRKQFEIDVYKNRKGGTNRHRAYWSAM